MRADGKKICGDMHNNSYETNKNRPEFYSAGSCKGGYQRMVNFNQM